MGSLVLAFFLLGPGGLPAQDPDPAALLKQSAAACRAIQGIEYEVLQFGSGTEPDVRGTLLQARADVPEAAFGGGLFLGTGTCRRGQKRFGWAYDGDRLRVLAAEEKEVRVLAQPTDDDVFRALGFETALLAFPQFMEEQPFATILARAEKLTYRGRTSVHGVECHQVEVNQVFTDPDGGSRRSTSTWALGVVDHLPRQMQSKSFRKEIARLELVDDLLEEDFALEVPDGFQRVAVARGAARRDGLLAVGASAPEWTLRTPQGEAVSLKGLRGRVVVLDFWGTWCGPCRRAMPSIQTLHERFAHKAVDVFGISVNEPPGADPDGFLREQGYDYGLLLHGESVARSYRVQAYPTLYILGPDGTVLHAEWGLREQGLAEWIQVIQKALDAP